MEEEEPEDKSVTRMKSVISAMVNKLKVKIDSTEKVLSDKLRVLDRDGDGEISYDDVKEVIGKVMKRGSSTEESVSQLFSLLDSNKDGKVSVAELLHYIHKKKESMEAEVLEVRPLFIFLFHLSFVDNIWLSLLNQKAQMKAAAAAAEKEKEKMQKEKQHQQQQQQQQTIKSPQEVSPAISSSVDGAKPSVGPKD